MDEEVTSATNTSSLSVSELRQHILFHQRGAGIHFFNHLYIMPLAEVIKENEKGILPVLNDNQF